VNRTGSQRFRGKRLTTHSVRPPGLPWTALQRENPQTEAFMVRLFLPIRFVMMAVSGGHELDHGRNACMVQITRNPSVEMNNIDHRL